MLSIFIVIILHIQYILKIRKGFEGLMNLSGQKKIKTDLYTTFQGIRNWIITELPSLNQEGAGQN